MCVIVLSITKVAHFANGVCGVCEVYAVCVVCVVCGAMHACMQELIPPPSEFRSSSPSLQSDFSTTAAQLHDLQSI